MIVGSRQDFLDRAYSRGYSLEQVLPCVVSQEGDVWTIDESHPAYPKERPAGPGKRLKIVLGWFYIGPANGCRCDDHAIEMDEKGPQWCRDNLETIVGWLREEAERRWLPFSEFAARTIVLRAIEWADAQSQPPPT